MFRCTLRVLLCMAYPSLKNKKPIVVSHNLKPLFLGTPDGHMSMCNTLGARSPGKVWTCLGVSGQPSAIVDPITFEQLIILYSRDCEPSAMERRIISSFSDFPHCF